MPPSSSMYTHQPEYPESQPALLVRGRFSPAAASQAGMLDALPEQHTTSWAGMVEPSHRRTPEHNQDQTTASRVPPKVKFTCRNSTYKGECCLKAPNTPQSARLSTERRCATQEQCAGPTCDSLVLAGQV